MIVDRLGAQLHCSQGFPIQIAEACAAMQAIANQGMTHGGSMGSKHPGTILNGISEEGQDTSTFQSESLNTPSSFRE